jgi:hypothetical protein
VGDGLPASARPPASAKATDAVREITGRMVAEYSDGPVTLRIATGAPLGYSLAQ